MRKEKRIEEMRKDREGENGTESHSTLDLFCQQRDEEAGEGGEE